MNLPRQELIRALFEQRLYRSFNAVAESLCSSLEFECLGLHDFTDHAHAQTIIGEYTDSFYNSERLHSTIG